MVELRPDEVVRLATSGDHRTLRRRCAGEVAGGASAGDVVRHCLAPAQAAVGERWLRNELSVADEHRATAVVDAALAELELRLPAPPPGAPKLVAVCAEGEWHATAARMVAIAAADLGVVPLCLGPSLPARDLGAAMSTLGVEGVLLSCSTVAALPGAARCLERLAQVGAPVAVGGHAFAAVPGAAHALGCSSFDDVSAAIDALPTSVAAPAADPEAAAAVGALDVADARLASSAARRLSPADAPTLAEAVGYLLGFARAALQFRNPSIVETHRDWLDTFLAARSEPRRFDDLAEVVAQEAATVLDDPGPLRAALGC